MNKKENNVQVLSIKTKTSISNSHGRENEGFTMSADDKQNSSNDDTVLPAITLRKVNQKYQDGDVKIFVPEKSKEESKSEDDESVLVYKISDRIPMQLTLLFAMQQALLSLSTGIAVSLLVSQVVCAENNDEIRAKLLSSTLFMNGITTLLMVTVGIRLPLYQGATPDYVAPLLAMAELDKDRCNFNRTVISINGTNSNSTIIETNEEELQGSLLAAGAIHFIIGATGLVGVLLRFIGPVTIVPTILTAAIAIILSLYLANFKMPIPVWTRKKGCHVIRYPLHQVFAILIALVVGWLVCLILTAAGAFSDDPKSKEFYSRTDSRSEIITKASWFYFPYPGQFGPIGFNISAFVGFVVATIVSILDSIGDYYACASTCRVPPPPSHGVNRGIAIEGFCSALSGAVGCGHATTTYGGNIGAIGLTRVASRWVFVGVSIIYIVFGIIGKISAIFITIPYPVLGGVLIVMFGAFNGVVLSNLKAVDLSSTRNLAIIGTSLLLGLMVPHWVEEYPDVIDTGNKEADNVITMLLGNPNLCGGVLACFLDNTIPGTLEERGIAEWQMSEITAENKSKYIEGFEVYEPLIPKKIKQMRCMRFLPFMPNPDKPDVTNKARTLSANFERRKSLLGTISTR
ncbi:hypothetical protein KUTeg_005030 [Tegillarca granosa]|uniref:Solute carrier family 23 member 2 n=1 Tax=Tegillarca granosa TaxID=220873 RepID=A0ABQ9FLR8_TEGGR|nr:hypothetical protein KUTeg_005030 [Tegillarca granosa]